MRALFILPTLQEKRDLILRLNPDSVEGHALTGSLLAEVPAFLGGDRAKAEEHMPRIFNYWELR